MLRLTFRAGRGETPKLIHAAFARFCVDGTVRGPEDFVIARRAQSGWWVGGDLHRIFECEGPLRVRVGDDRCGPAVNIGPFRSISASGGLFYGDDACLNVPVPGVAHAAGPVRQVTFLSEGSIHGKAKLPAREAAEGSGAPGAPAGKAAAQADARRHERPGGRR